NRGEGKEEQHSALEDHRIVNDSDDVGDAQSRFGTRALRDGKAAVSKARRHLSLNMQHARLGLGSSGGIAELPALGPDEVSQKRRVVDCEVEHSSHLV